MSRQQTLLARLGFNDEDSKRPEHDKIVSWLREQIDGMLFQLFPPNPPDITRLGGIAFGASVDQCLYLKEVIKKEEDELAKYQETSRTPFERVHDSLAENIARVKAKIEQLRKDLIDCQTWDQIGDPPEAASRLLIQSKVREKTLLAEHYKSNTVVGFLDLQVVADIPVGLNVQIKKYPAGYPNGVATRPYWSWSCERRTLNFEIKTAIPNLGDLLRQINVYREYQSGHYYVVCPDDRFIEELKQEKIGFIKAPAEFVPRSPQKQMALWSPT